MLLTKFIGGFLFRMLDEFGTELESTDSKLDSTMKKVAKVLRMSNGKLSVCCYYKYYDWFVFYRSQTVDGYNCSGNNTYDCDKLILCSVIFFI